MKALMRRARELRKEGLRVESQVLLPVVYDGVTIDLGYRMDLVVEGLVVVELKCVEEFNRVHRPSSCHTSNSAV